MSKKNISGILSLLIYFFSMGILFADEIRPGYLEIKETTDNLFSVIWKTPANGNKKLNIQPLFDDSCSHKTQATAQLINASYIQRWTMLCEQGLHNKTIAITGLKLTNTDVLLYLEFSNNTSQTVQLTPANAAYEVPEQASTYQIMQTYTFLGIEHILLGFDHLLFVLALLLIVKNNRRLLITITSFTLAHSITLAGATLGFIHVPQQPVEAVIALSILFLAVEIIHGQQGKPGYASRWPWMIAFIFGLLHGFGFAGALAEIALPSQAIPLALIFFNIGVEIGQLLFVFSVIIFIKLLHKLNQQKLLNQMEIIIVYSIGGLSSFWLIERINAF